MPRTISTAFLADLEALNAADKEIVLITVSYPSFTVRLCRDVVDHVWQGDTYFAAMFDIEFLSDDENEPRGVIRIPNADRLIGESILAIEEAPSLRIDILQGSTFGALQLFAFQRNAFQGNAFFNVSFTTTEATAGTCSETTLYGNADPIITADNLYLRNVRCTAQVVEADIVTIDLSVEPYPGVRATKDRLPGLYR